MGDDQDCRTDAEELYAYDKLNRLATMDRGTLTGNPYDSISGTPAREEDFTLDAVGNWTDYLVKTSGQTDLDQDREHNKANEITSITEGEGQGWDDPAHDAAGNATTIPRPNSPFNSFTCLYDAWNRLVRDKGRDKGDRDKGDRLVFC